MAADISHDLELIALAARGETVRDAIVDATKKIASEFDSQVDFWQNYVPSGSGRLITADGKVFRCVYIGGGS